MRRWPKMMCSGLPLDMLPFQRRSPIQRFWGRRWGQLSVIMPNVICPIPIPMPLQPFARKLHQWSSLASRCPSWRSTWIALWQSKARSLPWWIPSMIKFNRQPSPKSANLRSILPIIYTMFITYFWTSKIQLHSWDLTWMTAPVWPIIFYASPYYWPLSFPRLCTKLKDTHDGLGMCYSQLAKYVTELKMDLNDGTKVSERLDEFLGCIFLHTMCMITLSIYISIWYLHNTCRQPCSQYMIRLCRMLGWPIRFGEPTFRDRERLPWPVVMVKMIAQAGFKSWLNTIARPCYSCECISIFTWVHGPRVYNLVWSRCPFVLLHYPSNNSCIHQCPLLI